ncbi:alpha/beta hydrolase [Candidatus Woesearchaeota archaeon]|nr:alpha/beta hydrolase [Candidatus Woesearchaeota archaeon]
MYLMPIPVGDGRIQAAVSEPGVKYRPGTILVVKGLAWDARAEVAGRNWLGGRLGEIDQRLAGLGNTVVALSHAGYDDTHMKQVSVEGYLSDLAMTIKGLERQTGRVSILGHSLGGYFAARLAVMLKSAGRDYRVAMIGPPMSPSDSVGRAARVYLKMPTWLRHVPAHAGIALINLASKTKYLGMGRALPHNQELVDESLEAPALDDLAAPGKSLLGGDGLIIFGTDDLWIRRESAAAYAARCRRVTENVIPLEGQGHNFSGASDAQLDEVARTLDDFFLAKK